MTGGDRRGLPVGSAGTTRGLRVVWVVSGVQAKRAVWPLYVTATEDWNWAAPNPYHPCGVYPHRPTFPPDGDRLFCDCSITSHNYVHLRKNGVQSIGKIILGDSARRIIQMIHMIIIHVYTIIWCFTQLMGLIVGAGRPVETWSESSLWANRPYTLPHTVAYYSWVLNQSFVQQYKYIIV